MKNSIPKNNSNSKSQNIEFDNIASEVENRKNFTNNIHKSTQSQMNSTEEKGVRLGKILANAGYGSRSEVEEMITDGSVTVNGKVTVEVTKNVSSFDVVKIGNKIIDKNPPIRIWIFHKPTGCLVTRHDDKGRKNIFQLLPENMQNLIAIGRLDMNTEGLILLTNNGDLARYMELPATNISRKYLARVFGKLDENRLAKLQKGITIDGVSYGKVNITITKKAIFNSWLEIELFEGKNREIRKLMEYAGLQTNRLIRTSFGPFKLGKIPKNGVMEITTEKKDILINDFRKGKVFGNSSTKALNNHDKKEVNRTRKS